MFKTSAQRREIGRRWYERHRKRRVPLKLCCVGCGREFETMKVRKYCAKGCVEEARRRREANKSKGNYRACRQCGKQFLSFGTAICSDECRKDRAREWRGTQEQEIIWKRRAHNRRNKKIKLYAKAMRQLLGETYAPKRRERMVKIKACVQCGNDFTTNHFNQDICSDDCRRERRRTWVKPENPFSYKVCSGCSTEFVGRIQQHYCDVCRPPENKGIAPAKKSQEEKREVRRRTRARQRKKNYVYAKAMKQLLGETGETHA